MDLTTNYMGLSLKSPLIASASPLTSTQNSIQRLEQAGIGAVVLPSLFEEQIHQQQEEDERIALSQNNSFAEASTFFPAGISSENAADKYLNNIQQIKKSINIPVIASLNGCSQGGWVDYACQIEQAGADALELHFYYNPPSLEISGREVEALYVDVVKRVRAKVSIPLALKIDPFFSAFGHMAKQFDDAGINGLVMFNRMLKPDFNLQTMTVEPSWPISKPGAIGLPLRWIGVLHGKIKASLAATSGVYDHEDIVKYLLAGADTVMLASGLIQNGADYASSLRKGLELWMKQRGFHSLEELRGVMSQQSIANPETFERTNYLRIIDGPDHQLMSNHNGNHS